MPVPSAPPERPAPLRRVGLVAAPIAAILVATLLPERSVSGTGEVVELTGAARATAAIAVWMAIWWLTEAIPLYATALLPIVLLPLAGAASIREATAPYAHELIFLFMGGFIIALSVEKWGLHRRVSFVSLRLVGGRPTRIVAGFMAVTAFLSMWVSNTATSIMMLPIAQSVIDVARRSELATPAGSRARVDELGVCLLLSIAYAASIGGVGTLIGTPPNLFLASYLGSELGTEISFLRWMGVGLPLVAVFLPITWWLLTRVLHPLDDRAGTGGSLDLERIFDRLGPLRAGEWVTLVIASLTGIAWITRPLIADLEWGGLRPLAGLSDAGIAVGAALLLFAIPVDRRMRAFAMDWETAVRLPWGLLILFGGGLSLAAAINANGVGEWIGAQVGGLAGLPSWAVVVLVVALVIFLTELTSNTATTATLVPILAGLAPGLGLSPLLLIVPAAIAASCAFMLPVATPPNAVVFGSGLIRLPQMARAGLWMNAIGITLITALTYSVVPLLLDVTR